MKEGSKVVPGYVLVSVGDENVRNSSLLNIVELLATPQRPLNVKFEHSVFR